MNFRILKTRDIDKNADLQIIKCHLPDLIRISTKYCNFPQKHKNLIP